MLQAGRYSSSWKRLQDKQQGWNDGLKTEGTEDLGLLCLTKNSQRDFCMFLSSVSSLRYFLMQKGAKLVAVETQHQRNPDAPARLEPHQPAPPQGNLMLGIPKYEPAPLLEIPSHHNTYYLCAGKFTKMGICMEHANSGKSVVPMILQTNYTFHKIDVFNHLLTGLEIGFELNVSSDLFPDTEQNCLLWTSDHYVLVLSVYF